MAKKLLKIEARSVPYLYLAVILPLLATMLAGFGVIDLTKEAIAGVTIVVSLFVLSEIGTLGILRSKKLSKDPLRVFGSLVAVTEILIASLSLFNISISFLDPISGVASVLLIIYVIAEAFR